MASIEFFLAAFFASNEVRPSVRLRSWTTAMMCRVRLVRRLPARDRRWRCWAPEEASRGAAAVPGGEPVAVGEAADVADVGQQPGGSRGTDAVQAHQGGSASGHQVGQVLLRRLDPSVDALELADELDREA